MLAFVTGATGFVGSHVARALAEHGADVRLLVRPNSNTKNIADLKADLVIGDLRPRLAREGNSWLRRNIPCRRRLSPLGTRSRRDVSLEREWHPSSSGSGTKEPRSARGLYIERCDHGIYLEWPSSG